jgi:putative transposase
VRIRTKKHRLPDAAYFGEVLLAITACESKRLPMFRDPETVAVFVRELGEAVARRSCSVPVYCFMPDHLHLIVKGLEPRSRPKLAIEDFKQQTGLWLKARRPQFDWQADFYDHIIRSSEDWVAQAQYVAGNPVRAGLVEDLFAYPFSGSIGYDFEKLIVHGLCFREQQPR